MYEPAARQGDDELTDPIGVHFGYSWELLLLNRVLYALVRCNALAAVVHSARAQQACRRIVFATSK
jgi:hypothetical protein